MRFLEMLYLYYGILEPGAYPLVLPGGQALAITAPELAPLHTRT